MAENTCNPKDQFPPSRSQSRKSNPKTKPSKIDTSAFKDILSSLDEDNSILGEEYPQSLFESEDVEKAMKEAKSSFEAMKLIQKELQQHYQELKQMIH